MADGKRPFAITPTPSSGPLARVRLVLGTHTFDASGHAARRQEAAMNALRSLRGVVPVNVQFADGPHSVDGIETLATLARDSCTVTGVTGPRKPIVCDILDALCTRAEAAGFPRFAFMNADIHLAQQAVEWISEGAHDAWLFSREDYDGATGAALGMITAGIDVIALSTQWWRQNHRRFRPYILGEAAWDNVYTAIVMCHADAVLENRRPLARHEAHPIAWSAGGGPFGPYTQYLAALDSGYFSLWCRYWAGIDGMRRAGSGVDAERRLAGEVFAWRPARTERAVQMLRALKAVLRYKLRLPRRTATANF